METIGKRMAYVRKEIAKMSQTEFGQLLGDVHYTTVSSIELGKQNPTPQQLKIIKTQYNVCSDWILFGEGDKFGNADATALIAELEALKRKNFKLQSLLQEYMAVEEPAPAAGKLGKVKGTRRPVGFSFTPAIMQVVKTEEYTKTCTPKREASRRA